MGAPGGAAVVPSLLSCPPAPATPLTPQHPLRALTHRPVWCYLGEQPGGGLFFNRAVAGGGTETLSRDLWSAQILKISARASNNCSPWGLVWHLGSSGDSEESLGTQPGFASPPKRHPFGQSPVKPTRAGARCGEHSLERTERLGQEEERRLANGGQAAIKICH